MPISHTATRIAFVVIIVFVLAQVIWWILFQSRYITNITNRTVQMWQEERDLVNILWQQTSEAQSRETIQARFPQLDYDADRDQFVIKAQTYQKFLIEQHGYIRMFAYEGPFFVLVVLSGLWIIALSLRAERDLKKRQQNFLSAVTHEVKTPISSLRLLIETALMRDLPKDKQKDYLRRMEAELSRIEQTSEQVLASARLEQSATPPVLAPEDLNEVIAEIETSMRLSLETQGAELKVYYYPEPLPVSIDSQALRLVVNNLLDNAIKYTPQTPKPIEVRLEAQEHLVLLHVTDAGVGIAARERQRVFERFYRTGNELTRTAKGMGLGLHLVKSITEAMHGWVKVEPNGTRGTRFSVVLPRRVS